MMLFYIDYKKKEEIILRIYFKKILALLIAFLLLLTLTGCGDKKDLSMEDKVKEELGYLDYEIINLINTLNNITIENYKIASKEVSLRKF